MMVTVTKCGECGRQRGKQAKPWRTCEDCKVDLCLFCAPAHNTNPRCRKCFDVHFEAKLKKQRETPVECQACHAQKLPAEMANPYVPTICRDCDTRRQNAEIAKREALEAAAERAWIPGTLRRVEVDGYTYLTDLPVKVGTKVLLPESWLAKVTGKTGPWEGTVTSLITDYTGPCSRIIKICDVPEAPEQKVTTPPAKDFESMAAQIVEHYGLNDQDCRELGLKLLMRDK